MEINIKNKKISYIDTGVGDVAIVFLHGWGACKENFNQTIELLKNKYRCIALDLPGFGRSDKLTESFFVDDYADIVSEFIKELKIIDVILVGHSYGGRIIIKLNNRTGLPFIIKKNIFIDAAGIRHKQSIDKKVRVSFFKLLKSIVGLAPGSDHTKEKRLDNLRSKFGSNDYKNADPIMRETLVKAVNEDLKPYLKNIKVETLLIWGDKDTATPISDAKIFEKEIKNSGLAILKGCGHFSFVDDSYTYLKIIESYLLR